jgi:SNF2-related domain/Domain of unknown function (DUF3535)
MQPSRTDERVPSPNANAVTSDHAAKSDPLSSSSLRCLQTPHTIRLLKLIREGSPEYAEPAIVQLEATTVGASSSSSYAPVQLWDLMGRITSIALSSTWKTREMAAVALQAMARHLPPTHVHHFLHATFTNTPSSTLFNDADNTGPENLFLRLADLQNGGMEVVLRRGRKLYATAQSHYDISDNDRDDDDARLQNLANMQSRTSQSSTTSTDVVSCVPARVELQRRILARRLGLNGIVDAIPGHDKRADFLLEDTITNADLQLSSTPADMGCPVSKRPRWDRDSRSGPQRDTPIHLSTTAQVDDAVALESSNDPTTLRALLVMESMHETPRNGNLGNTSTSCSNPQTLLATELVYRMMDPVWYVRHGAASGVLALLRAWYNQQPSSTPPEVSPLSSAGNDQRPELDCDFGVWPQDILARSLCILALDRFGDFSGGGLDMEDGSLLSTSVVAPVREVVAQIVSVLWAMIPSGTTNSLSNNKDQALAILYQLCRYKDDDSDEWEVRHGALLALKYVVVVISTGVLRDTIVGRAAFQSDDYDRSILSAIAMVAAERLSDPSDDVKSVAALALMEIGRHHSNDDTPWPEFLWNAVAQLWGTLKTARQCSSCVVELVALLAMFVQNNANQFVGRLGCGVIWDDGISMDRRNDLAELEDVIAMMLRLFDSDFLSVRLAAMRCIGALCKTIARIDGGTSRPKMLGSMQTLVQRTFDFYFCNTRDESSIGCIPSTLLDTVWKLVSETFVDLATCCSNKLENDCRTEPTRISGNTLRESVVCSAHPADALCHLLARYFELGRRRSEEPSLTLPPVAAAAALSYFVYRASQCIGILSAAQLVLVACFHSPWPSQFEGACLLYRALKEHKMDNALLDGFEQLLDAEAAPLCMDETVPLDEAIANERDGAILKALRERAGSTKFSLEAERALVPNSSGTSFGSPRTRIVSEAALMRVRATLAGAVLAKGLPSRLTPLIRSLMTSFNNETESSSRNAELCNYLGQLLQLMRHEPKFERGYHKVVDALCEAATQSANKQQSLFLRAEMATSILQSFARNGQRLVDIVPLQRRLIHISTETIHMDDSTLTSSCILLRILVGGLAGDLSQVCSLIDQNVPSLIALACAEHRGSFMRESALSCLENLCSLDASYFLKLAIPTATQVLQTASRDQQRVLACQLVEKIVQASNTAIRDYVRCLLPLVLSLVTDCVSMVGELANSIFSALVRVAPLVKEQSAFKTASSDAHSESVIDHLIFAKPLPPLEFPDDVTSALVAKRIRLRSYQEEGIAWLKFLWSTNLSGALCDGKPSETRHEYRSNFRHSRSYRRAADMGLGKSIQALVAVALAHNDLTKLGTRPISLVICPSSLLGLWEGEIDKYFPASSLFQVLCLAGSRTERQELWNLKSDLVNIVITSYAVLRSDIDFLEREAWSYIVLDEGHLLKNPKTGKCVSRSDQQPLPWLSR